MMLEFLSVEGVFIITFITLDDCMEIRILHQDNRSCVRLAKPDIFWEIEDDIDKHRTPDDVRQFIDKVIANKTFL